MYVKFLAYMLLKTGLAKIHVPEILAFFQATIIAYILS
jgi:hypothetical protein